MKHLYFLIISVLFLSACTPYGYVSQIPVNNMFEHTGESKVNVAVGGNHVEIQAAYALSNHIGLGVNNYRGQTDGYTVCAEYFTRIHNRTYFSLQGGFGEQKMNFSFSNYFLGYNLMYTSFFTKGYYTANILQPSFYTSIDNGRIKAGFVYRFSQNNYRQLELSQQKKYGSRTGPKEFWTIENPDKVNTHTFIFSYQKDSKSRKYFYQMQLGFVYSGKINIDNFLDNPNNNKVQINQYTIPFNPFVFNLTGGINLDYFYTNKKYN